MGCWKVFSHLFTCQVGRWPAGLQYLLRNHPSRTWNLLLDINSPVTWQRGNLHALQADSWQSCLRCPFLQLGRWRGDLGCQKSGWPMQGLAWQQSGWPVGNSESHLLGAQPTIPRPHCTEKLMQHLTDTHCWILNFLCFRVFLVEN